MAIAHGAQTRFPTTDTTGFDITTGNRTFSHAGGASACGAVVVLNMTGTVATVTGVLYGGVAMTLKATATDTSEAGRIDIYTLVQGVPTGTQTVTLQGCTATQKWCTCSTVTSATNEVTVVGSNFKNTTTAANPTMNVVTTGTSLLYGSIHGGDLNTTSYGAGSGYTIQFNGDYGALVSRSSRSTATVATGTIVYNFTFATSDDYCLAAVALAEVVRPDMRENADGHSTALGQLTTPSSPVVDYFVTASGSDAADGLTLATAWRTLTFAATQVAANKTVGVAQGDYLPFDSTTDGTSGNRIVYRSLVKWGARLVQSGTKLTGNYTDIIDFEFTDPLLVGASNIMCFVDGDFSRIIGCWVHDFPRTIDGANGAAGILLQGNDDHSGHHCEARNNVVHDIGGGVPSQLRHGLYVSCPDCTVIGNLCYSNAGDGITSWHAATRMICINNTSASNQNGGIYVGNGDFGGTALGHEDAKVYNNIITNNTRYALVETSDFNDAVAGGIYRNNMIFGNNPLNDNGGNALYVNVNSVETGTSTSDPLYVDETVDNYRLQPTSPALETGYVDALNPTIDLDNHVRPQGATIDRGAFELATASLSGTTAGTGTATGALAAIVVGLTQWALTAPKATAAAQTGPSWSITPNGANNVALVWVGAIRGASAVSAASLSGTTAGVGAVTGALKVPVALNTTTEGVGLATGALTATSLMSGTVAGTGTVTGALTATSKLTGTVAGIGTVTGALTAPPLLTGTTAGLGTVTGALAATRLIVGTTAGIGTVTGALTASPLLTGTAVGLGTLTGALTVTMPIAGTVAGVGTATGALTATALLTGTAAGVGTVTGALAAMRLVSGTVAGIGNAPGALTATSLLAGTTAGIGNVTGALTAPSLLTGTLAGVGSATGALTATTLLSGTTVGIGSVTGAVNAGTPALFGTVAGTSTSTGALTATSNLTGTAAGIGSLTGALTALPLLTGTSAGIGTVTGALAAQTFLSGTVAGVSTVTGAINAGTPALFGTLAGLSTATGALTATALISGTTAGLGALTGVLATPAPFAGTTAGTSSATGALTATSGISGTTAGTGNVTGALTATSLLTGTVAGTGTVTGALTATTFLSGTTSGVSTVTGALAATRPLTGTPAGLGTVTGALTATSLLTGTVAGTGAVTGALVTPTFLSGTTVGVSSVTGALNAGTPALFGTLVGAGLLTGALTATALPTGTTVGFGTLTGVLASSAPFTGTIAGNGSVTGALTATSLIAATTDGTGASTGALTATSKLTGTVAGIGLVSGALTATSVLTGTTAGTSTVTGTMGTTPQVAGTVAGVGALTGVISGTPQLSGTSAGTGAVNATIFIPGIAVLVGTSNGVAATAGALAAMSKMTGIAVGTSGMPGVLASFIYLAGPAAGKSTLLGSVIGIVPVEITSSGDGGISQEGRDGGISAEHAGTIWVAP